MTKHGTVPSVCSIEDCGKKHFSRGYCSIHYGKFQREGAFGHDRCIEVGCERFGINRKYCNVHYKARRKRGEFVDAPPCAFEGCDRVSMVKGFCHAHRRQQQKGEELRPLIGQGNWGRWVPNTFGYMQRFRSLGPGTGKSEYQLQHRFVMEEAIGRALTSSEEVHHKNGDRADNRLENLQLWSTKQPKGQHWRDKLEYAREILALYEPLEKSGFHDGESGDRE